MEDAAASLKGKRLLIVDDEPDVLEMLVDLLDGCYIDTARSHEAGARLLQKNQYDAAILDIMGVDGHELLKQAVEKDTPALMLTAHALNPDALVESIKTGAQAYVPKDKMADIHAYLLEVLEFQHRSPRRRPGWFLRLKPFFDRKFGRNWREKEPEFWQEFDRKYEITRQDLEEVL
jgi:CheY-like chemotaxis protein